MMRKLGKKIYICLCINLAKSRSRKEFFELLVALASGNSKDILKIKLCDFVTLRD